MALRPPGSRTIPLGGKNLSQLHATFFGAPGIASLAKRGLSVVRVVDGDFELALGLFGHKVSVDEGGEVAVKDSVDVADAEFGAVVLDETIGLHDVGTDLAAERDVELRFVESVGFVTALLNFQVVEFRAQHLHGHFAVLALAALHLAGDDDPSGNVGNPDGGFHFVDVLAALAAGAEGVELQVIRLDVDFDAVVHFGNDEDGGERSVATRGLIEGGNAYESVHAGFAGEQAVGIFTAELDRGVLDAGFFAGGFIEQVGGDAVTLRPAEIHAQKNRGPILRFGAAGTGLDGHNGVEVVDRKSTR